MIAFITGSNFYEISGFCQESRETRFGRAFPLRGEAGGREILVLPRHGLNHRNLPHHIDYRANLVALREAGATAVVSLSACGLTTADRPLASPLIAEDLYFPENRLPDGSPCTVFLEPGEAGRGHLLAQSFFNCALTEAIRGVWKETGREVARGVYGHVNGPRFNSRVEIRALAHHGVDFISQTCGPEAVLANELELPYALAGFSVDYANGVREEPTPVKTLQSNLDSATGAFLELIQRLPARVAGCPFENFVYRFDS